MMNNGFNSPFQYLVSNVTWKMNLCGNLFIYLNHGSSTTHNQPPNSSTGHKTEPESDIHNYTFIIP